VRMLALELRGVMLVGRIFVRFDDRILRERTRDSRHHRDSMSARNPQTYCRATFDELAVAMDGWAGIALALFD